MSIFLYAVSDMINFTVFASPDQPLSYIAVVTAPLINPKSSTTAARDGTNDLGITGSLRLPEVTL